MRPYIPNDRVGDIKSELPHYYCNLHNPDPYTDYPAKPGSTVTIIQTPPVTDPSENNPKPDPEVPDKPNGDKDNEGSNGNKEPIVDSAQGNKN